MPTLKYLDPATGTYKQIAGLPGPPGPTGPKGADGVIGVDGAPGPPGPAAGAVLEPTYATSRGQATAISVPNATSTQVTFDAAIYADGITWDGAGGFIAPVAGYYDVEAVVSFATSNTTGLRTCWISVNGAQLQSAANTPQASQITSAVIAGTVKCAAGDVISIKAYQTSGAAVNLTAGVYTRVSITKVPTLSPGGGGVVVEHPVTAMRRNIAGTSILASTVTAIPFDTEVYQEGGITWSEPDVAFVVPSDGYYQVEFGITYALTNTTGVRVIYPSLNGLGWASIQDEGTVGAVAGSVSIKALAGDKINLRTQQTSGVTLPLVPNLNYNWISVTKLPVAYAGSAVSTYGERNYAASWRQSAAVSMTSGVATQIPWDSEDFTDGITKDSTGIFTVPVAGYYQVNAKLGFAQNATGYRRIRILQNGASAVPGYSIAVPSSGATTNVVLARTIKCAAGDTVQVQADHSAGVALDTINSTAYNSVDIHKVPAPVVNGAAASGVWGVGPLAGLGSDSLIGSEIYIDSKGQLRGTLPVEVEDTGWVNVTVVAGFAAIVGAPPLVRRIGNVVYLKGGFANTGITANGSLGVGIIPAGFVPMSAFYSPAGTSSAATTAQSVIGAGAGDSIQIRAGATISSNYYLNCSWLLD